MLRMVQRQLVITSVTLVLTAMLGSRSAGALAATVTLSPGSNIQRAVNANPAGTIFVLRPGIYREQSITSLKNGDSFIGQAGAIMNGSKLLTGWTEVSINGVSYWTTAGGMPLPTPRCGVAYGCCLAGYPGCAYVQDLYVDNISYRHATSLAGVVAGKSWNYDFAGTDGGIQNNIYLAAGDDPNSHQVELAEREHAFVGTAANITIKNLIIEKYAAPISSAAVEAEGPGWLLENDEVRLNHGIGISDFRGGDNIRVIGNRVHHNGQMGMGGPGSGGLWDSNYVAYNNIDGINPAFEGGGTKFVGSYVVIRNNIVHDNYGPGLWTDAGATHDTYDHNTSYNNFADGIRYEISRWGVIENNTVYGNLTMPQITYAGSDHGRIIGNTVISNGHGAIIVTNLVGTRLYTPVYRVVDTQVIGNRIETPCKQGIAAVGLLDFARPPQPGIFSDPTNIFDHNTYTFLNPSQFANQGLDRRCWAWGEGEHGRKLISWRAWHDRGQDLHGGRAG